ncbi:MAG: 6-carboxytetrahydropterin synthase, partial [Planctomycetaceae bacterium]|nr:6-carboxytetrahydropterin synthase [Planctomycetaceae bacterium]
QPPQPAPARPRPMVYRVCKSFEVESGHMLSKHPGLCRYPHGHSRRVDVVLSADTLDDRDMVCDFKALKLALKPWLDQWDHAMAVNSADPSLPALRQHPRLAERLVTFQNEDPTTEAMARVIFQYLAQEIAAGKTYRDQHGSTYTFPPNVKLERVRVTETSSSWAEYGL